MSDKSEIEAIRAIKATERTCAHASTLLAHVDALEARVARLEEALRNISTVKPTAHCPAVTALTYCRGVARAALAEVKGE